MTAQELLPLVKQLTRPDKLRLMQTLLYNLAQEEGVSLPATEELLQAGQTYPVWSPATAYDAADVLLRVLKDKEADGA
ncbi:MAG TPA: hypothetical protein EYP41_21875 [Anaerolineae bacterium]|nr:hypothetical protein [Anaerolineae bacterium]HIP73303.1 hypothetical protein [Anaerolineae bacterium]